MQPVKDAKSAVVSVAGAAGTATGKARFPADLAVLAGHFPSQPLIPGVHLLALVAEVACRTGIAVGTVQSVEKAKWSAPVYPEEDLDISVVSRSVENGWRVDGEIKKGAVVCSTCRLLLG
jgi:3-hydroxymyristoyl/3-hydroxydecanoyl-(acyl carrier protein) dehydratase